MQYIYTHICVHLCVHIYIKKPNNLQCSSMSFLPQHVNFSTDYPILRKIEHEQKGIRTEGCILKHFSLRRQDKDS